MSFDFALQSSQPSTPVTLSEVLEARRTFVSGQLSEVCRETRHPKILSIANGALREAEAAVPLCQAAGGKFVVLDGTGEPPDVLQFNGNNSCLRHISYPYGAIPSRENIGQFDYVYALNLLNELDQSRARAVIIALLSLVRPGGRLLLSNFTAEFAMIANAGFYRREEDLGDLVPDSGEHGLLGHAIWRDESRTLLYLEIQKAGLMSGSSTPGPGFLH